MTFRINLSTLQNMTDLNIEEIFDSVPDELRPDRMGYKFVLKEESEHDRGIYWKAVVSRNGVEFLTVYNMGDGGCNRYTETDELMFSDLQFLASDAFPSMSEPMDILILWLDYLCS